MFDRYNQNGASSYVEDSIEVKKKVLESVYRCALIVDSERRLISIITRSDLIYPIKKKVILVDHNEKSQTLTGVEEAEILEIIDHHRLGDISTLKPIFVYNDPVGSACTIVGELITVLDRQELNPLEKGIKKEMEKIKKEREYDLVVFLIATPLERKGEEIWVKGEKEIVKKAFGVKLEGDSCFIPRILSRKKDFIPKIGYSFEEI